MREHEGIVLIVDGPSTWRANLAKALEESGYAAQVSDRGEEIINALAQDVPSRKIAALLIGSDLSGTSAIDSLYLADKKLREAKRARPDWPVSTILLITDVREDVDYLRLCSSRGVNGFIHREDDFEKTILLLSGGVYANQRIARRYPTHINAKLVAEGSEIQAVIADLSPQGAFATAPDNRSSSKIEAGHTLMLNFTGLDADKPITCQAIVRNIKHFKSLFRSQIGFGLQFVRIDAASRNQLDSVLEELKNQSSMLENAASNQRLQRL